MGLFRKRTIKDDGVSAEKQIADPILSALIKGKNVGRSEAMNIPVVSSSVDLICNTFASIPFKLYRKINENEKNRIEKIEDKRVFIINEDTRDTLDGFQFKKAICEDYLMGKRWLCIY